MSFDFSPLAKEPNTPIFSKSYFSSKFSLFIAFLLEITVDRAGKMPYY